MIKRRGSNSLSESFDSETNFQSPRKEGLTDKVRQKISAAGKIIQGSRPSKVAEPDLTHLTARSQVRHHKKTKDSFLKIIRRNLFSVQLKQ